MQQITVIVEDGGISEIKGIPEGYKVVVQDFDWEDGENKNEHGVSYHEMTFPFDMNRIDRIEELENILQKAQDELKAMQEPTEKIAIATCGECGLSWDDAAISSITPTPSGRCPFEYVHEEARELRRLNA